jgi:hypothetical protein
MKGNLLSLFYCSSFDGVYPAVDIPTKFILRDAGLNVTAAGLRMTDARLRVTAGCA